MVAGYGYTGKTIVAQTIALAIAAGTLLWGKYPVRRGRVVHVDFEQGEQLTRRRYQRLARPMGVDLASLRDALTLACEPELALTQEFIRDWRELMTGRDLLILDSLWAAGSSQDENSPASALGLKMLRKVSGETGCRALVIHHARKGGPDDSGGRFSIRGSSAIFGELDCAFVFSAGSKDLTRVEHVKARSDGKLVDSFALAVSDVEIEGQPSAGLRVVVCDAPSAARDRSQADAATVRRVLEQRPGLGTTDLREQARLSGDRFSAALGVLGDDVETHDQKDGRSKRKQHFLRQQQHHEERGQEP
jgi:hypothetical protein